MGLNEILHYWILTWPLVLCTIFYVFPLYSVVLNILVFLILTHMLLSTCSYFTPHWEIWVHLKGRIFHFFILGFQNSSFIFLLDIERKSQSYSIPQTYRSRTELGFRNTCHHSFLASSFYAWLTRACLSVPRVAVASAIAFLLVGLPHRSLMEAVICSLLGPSRLMQCQELWIPLNA